ncbi:unnamed protein product, partial [Nesidiocoris tenuis]
MRRQRNSQVSKKVSLGQRITTPTLGNRSQWRKNLFLGDQKCDKKKTVEESRLKLPTAVNCRGTGRKAERIYIEKLYGYYGSFLMKNDLKEQEVTNTTSRPIRFFCNIRRRANLRHTFCGLLQRLSPRVYFRPQRTTALNAEDERRIGSRTYRRYVTRRIFFPVIYRRPHRIDSPTERVPLRSRSLPGKVHTDPFKAHHHFLKALLQAKSPSRTTQTKHEAPRWRSASCGYD